MSGVWWVLPLKNINKMGEFYRRERGVRGDNLPADLHGF